MGWVVSYFLKFQLKLIILFNLKAGWGSTSFNGPASNLLQVKITPLWLIISQFYFCNNSGGSIASHCNSRLCIQLQALLSQSSV